MGKYDELRRFLHWGPIIILVLTFFVTNTTFHLNHMWWPLGKDCGSWINYGLIWFHFFTVTYYFLRTLIVGPGFVPKKWQPKKRKHELFLQYCTRCEGFKPPRAHHCRRCDRCVMKMDHHCPWVNNCVGWMNQGSFIYFLLFFLSASVQGIFIIIPALARGISKSYYMNNNMKELATVHLTKLNCMASIVTLGVYIGMGFASLKLLHMQLKLIFSNKTEIERWIITKANYRRDLHFGMKLKPFVYPYDLGWRFNYQEVFVPSGDGYRWPVLPGCNQYTLTMEQLEQKKEKRARTHSFRCVRPATGHWLPLISQGIWVCMTIPCNDDPRIVLQPGDIVRVTRAHQFWMYGERVVTDEEMAEGKMRKGAKRGWFPRECVLIIQDEDSDTEENKLTCGQTFTVKDKSDGKLANMTEDTLAGGDPPLEESSDSSADEDPPLEESKATSAGGEPPLEESKATSAGGDPPLEESKATSVGGDPPLEESKATSAGGEPPLEESKATSAGGDPPLEESKATSAGGDPPLEESKDKNQEIDPNFKRTLKLVENENCANLDDEIPPWDEEEEYDFGGPLGKSCHPGINPWQDGTRKRVL